MDLRDFREKSAICHVGAEDLNAWMVREGLALAYVRYSSEHSPIAVLALIGAGDTLAAEALL